MTDKQAKFITLRILVFRPFVEVRKIMLKRAGDAKLRPYWQIRYQPMEHHYRIRHHYVRLWREVRAWCIGHGYRWTVIP